ncbi:hypothetical protein T440DRAFT_407807 [Plenodomus tracheiphilus IPT5]|uniref:Rhodopsin domain-containing protein n=1 Tax=Plenodomus tracheiphilus IPT5 TaxID=1408161 RepID=A0A6A7AQW5_9PLEO|nr:hypothetical protein T440DRAFT_407807 [Plenodomus tracheiphilus IPT5]
MGTDLASRDACVGVAVALTAVSAVAVILRTYTRALIIRSIGQDDYTMLLALLLVIGYLVAIFVDRANGMGLSGLVLTPRQMVVQVQTALAIEIIYYLAINAIKVSILLFYLRIAAVKRFDHLCKATICFLAVFCTVCIVCCLVQCVPLHKLWDFTGMVQGHCINTTALFYTTSSINIVVDIWILVLPITTLLKVQRPTREKLALVGIFSLGVFSCIASIVRLHSIRIYTESKDPFLDSVPINLWSMVELNMGILCASIPSLKALFSKAQRSRSIHNGTYRFHSHGFSGVKHYGKNSGSMSAAGTAGDAEPETYVLKDVESGERLDSQRSASHVGGAWLANDSEVDQNIVHPNSRI